MKYDTVIGVLTHSRLDLLRECLLHIYENTLEFDRCVLVIANNSTNEDYIAKVERLASQYGATTLNHRRGRGTSAAWNAMSRIYDCEQVAIISDDVKVHYGWQIAMDYGLSSIKNAGVLGLRGWNGQHEWKNVNDVPFESVSHLLDKQLVIYPCGFLLMYRRDRFEEIGGFDENIWMGLEEVDFAVRMMKQGYANYQIGLHGEPYKLVSHYGFATGYKPEDAAPELREQAARNIQYFQEKHQTTWPLTQEFEERLRNWC